MIKERIQYYGRLIPAYLGGGTSQLTFWHEEPTVNEECTYNLLGQYYMTFHDKAQYRGPFDERGIPLLDYRGIIGRQYNPIAIAQYGLANFNKFKKEGIPDFLDKAVRQADWLVENLIENDAGIPVWIHDFDWEYREMLKAPWYSGLAQGNGISLLARIAQETGDDKYRESVERAYVSMTLPLDVGGVIYIDKNKDCWIEEVIIEPPTHILNGFLWAVWGIWDLYLLTGKEEIKSDFGRFVTTLEKNLHRYDIGYWSLYELAGLKLKMLASPFYHSLHCVQLRITATLTGVDRFMEYAQRWERYADHMLNRGRALAGKVLFKTIYY